MRVRLWLPGLPRMVEFSFLHGLIANAQIKRKSLLLLMPTGNTAVVAPGIIMGRRKS